ncbi:MAG: methionyl-tRNA formyltransferase [Calditrichaeota bacterium]|nr:methionyl-tRNA formyltransferase [Calditrichota bacterium]
MGTPEFAVPSLRHLHHSRHTIVGVVTQPDKPRGRGQKVTPSPVKQFALEHHLHPILQPQKLKDPDFLKSLRALGADLFVVVAFRILPEEVFTMPPKGTVNLHPSLLPRFRGAAPIQWTIIRGERVTGVTTIFIRKEVDAGNIILQREIPVPEGATAGELHDLLAEEGARLLLETLDAIEENRVRVKPQDERLVTSAPKITREMAHLKFDQPADQVRNWIHGLSPVPGAHAFYRGQQVKFYRARVVNRETEAGAPGEILKAEGSELWIACKPGILAVEEIQMQNRKRLPVEAFLRGFPLAPGERFT